MNSFAFGGHDWQLLPESALYWPARGALLVADLHLEKASWFARLGQFLPPYDSLATLQSLERLVERTGARTIYCLGDSFHDRFGCDRLPERARHLLLSLIDRVEWVWITGNHDAGMIDHCGGEILVESEVDGVLLRHEAEAGETRPEISGHFHPKLRVQMKGRHISRRCFVASERKMILPAFGSLAGGLDASHPEIRRAMGGRATALVPVTDRLLRFPIAA